MSVLFSRARVDHDLKSEYIYSWWKGIGVPALLTRTVCWAWRRDCERERLGLLAGRSSPQSSVSSTSSTPARAVDRETRGEAQRLGVTTSTDLLPPRAPGSLSRPRFENRSPGDCGRAAGTKALDAANAVVCEARDTWRKEACAFRARVSLQSILYGILRVLDLCLCVCVFVLTLILFCARPCQPR